MKDNNFSPEETALMEEFPLKVAMSRLSGRKVVLHWYADEDRNHLIIGSSDEQVFSIFQKVLESNQYEWRSARPLALIDIDIVSPPDKLKLAYAKQMLELDKENFVWFVQAGCVALNPDLPEGVESCPEYVDSENPDISLPWKKEDHWDCRNCGGLRFIFDKDEFYKRYKEAWAKQPLGDLPEWKISQAPQADPNQKLYGIFGSDVADFREVNSAESLRGFNFFCHILGQRQIPQNLLALAQQRHDEEVRKEEACQQSFQQQEQLRKYQTIREYREFFNMPDLDMLLEHSDQE